MITILACVYGLIGLVCWLYSIKWMKKRGYYVDFEDLLMSFLLFGVLWFIGYTLLLWSKMKVGETILDWVNKK